MSPLAHTLQDLRALDALAARPGPLAQRDARAKLLVTACFVLTLASFGRHQVSALLPLALFPTVLAAQAALPARTWWRTLLLASPLVLMLGLANPLLDPAPALHIAGLAVSAGWLSFAALLLRCALGVSVALVLLGSTGMPGLCAALSRLGVPRVLTVQLLLLHRYLFVLADEALRMARAQSLRAVSARRMGPRVYASLMGQLLLRALGRAERVHQAMLARGFDGELRLAQSGHWTRGDTVFTAGWCLYFAVVRLVDLPQALGSLLGKAL